MDIVRRLALAALCVLMPFAIAGDASAEIAPRTFVDVTLRDMRLPLTSYGGTPCAGPTIPPFTTTLEVGGNSAFVSVVTAECGNARISEWLVAWAYWDRYGDVWVTVVGAAGQYRRIDGTWRQQGSQVEIGRNVLVPADTGVRSWTIGTGNGSGKIYYRIVTRER
jgi:hypothetical protein